MVNDITREKARGKLGEVKEGERVIGDVSDNGFDDYCLYCLNVELTDEIQEIMRQCKEKMSVLEARKILFWDAMRKSSERAESSGSRGMTLGVRIKDGKPVLVEFKEQAIQSIFDVLKGFQG